MASVSILACSTASSTLVASSIKKASKIVVGLMESERYLGDYALNPYKFSNSWFKAGNGVDVPDRQWKLKDVELRININENDGFRSQNDPIFKTQFMKLHKSLHGLLPVSCPDVTYDTFMDNSGECRR